MSQLSPSDRTRYSRHLSLPDFRESHQRSLLESSVLVIGAGGLGSSALLYLAAAGFGRIGIIDNDVVELSNLQRQVIHSEADLGIPKVDSAARRVREINSNCTVEIHRLRLSSSNARPLLQSYDIILDGSDNLPTRYLVNDVCVLTKRPLVYGSVFRYEGQVSVFATPSGPCYRCLFPTPPPPLLVPSCQAAGVLGVVPGLIGMYQANEAIKLATGLGEPLVGKLQIIDLQENRHSTIGFARNQDCPACGPNPTATGTIDYESFCGMSKLVPGISAIELNKLLQEGVQKVLLVDVREPAERDVSHIGGLHIPIGDLSSRAIQLTNESENQAIVLYCRSGQRSAAGVQILTAATELRTVVSLEGGLLAWQTDVDSSMIVR